MKKICRTLALLAFAGATPATAQSWSPQKNVEIVAASAPGGSNDNTARTLERMLSENRLVPTTLTVVNKPGGGATIAHTYVNQRAGDPHYLLIATSGLLSNHIIGASVLTLADFTPIAALLEDYVVFAVAAGSPLETGKDLPDRLRKDPRSLTLGFANAFGSSRHIAAGLTAEWRSDLEKTYWTPHFVTGARLKSEIEREYAATKAVLADLGLAKQP